MQQENELAVDFAADLRKLSLYCDFKENLNCSLVDQFIFGTNDSSLQKRLLLEKDEVTFENIIQLAKASELSNKSSAILQNKISYSNTFKINSFNKSKPTFREKIRKITCKHCGEEHRNSECSFKEAVCYFCKKKGHIKAICRAYKKNNEPIKNKEKHFTSNQISEEEEVNNFNEEGNLVINTNFAINYHNVSPIVLNLNVDNTQLCFEVDTGAAVSILPYNIFKQLWPGRKLLPTNIILRAFDHLIKPLGVCKVTVKYKNLTAKNLELVVTKEGTSTLLGRAWFHALGFSTNFIKCGEVENINHNNSEKLEELKLNKLLDEFKELFSSELGCIRGHTAKLFIKKNAIPKFFKHRQVPLALLPKIEEELNKLQAQGILKPIKYSSWAAPIVPIVKKTGDLRLCGDYKVGLNPNLEVNKYPLPIIEEILTKLSGGTVFSKLDLAQAYQQVNMDEESTKYLTINTHKGLFSVSRLPFGIASAPAIFQQIMDTILAGIDNVSCYLDDILIASVNKENHIKDLKRVFTALNNAGVRLKLEKCEFFKNEVEYLGHIINTQGVSPSPEKIKAIISAPEPKNVDQLRSFLGLVGYYRKFIPDLATKITGLNRLLCKNEKWIWDTDTAKQFELVKKTITSGKILVHYNPKLPIILATDASPWGIAAILSHKFEDGSEKPIMFASRSLTRTEQNYSQLDKEALGIVFGVKKFHKFLYGRKFSLFTDHKPLTRIFHPNKEIPVIAASRLQRWAIILAAYDFDINYKTSKDNSNADALSRLPLKNSKLMEDEETQDILMINLLENFPWSIKDIANETSQDKELSQICTYVKNGWPHNKKKGDTIPKHFKLKQEQLSIQEGCLLWGLRVIIPSSIRRPILQELHRGHIGIVKMKLLARSICWWPQMDSDIEHEALACRACQLQARNPSKTMVHHWIRPGGPWERVHLDLMGPFLGKMFMLVVDAFSKWPEVIIIPGIDSNTIMMELDKIFTRYGYPNQLISDNGTQFTSGSFEDFCKNRGIRHTKSPPYHPASNGQAERFVDIFKSLLGKLQFDNKVPLQIRLNELLFKYRCTPHITIRQTPAEMFLGRTLRDRLQRINPLPPIPLGSFAGKFINGQRVLARSFHLGKFSEKWQVGTIKKILSPVSYWIAFEDGREGKRHADQLRPCYLPETTATGKPPTMTTTDMDWSHLQIMTSPPLEAVDVTPQPLILDPPSAQPGPPPIRYSSRARRPPDRFTN